jgi:cytochrome c6
VVADLEANGLANAEDIFNIVYNGKGKMPGYGEGCTPKGACTFATRLSDDTIRDLSAFVLKQANAGWE